MHRGNFLAFPRSFPHPIAVSPLPLVRIALLVLPFLFGSCMQRTVTRAESRYAFSEGWSSQLGDEKKLKKKFASGFEIKDGQAVATNERKLGLILEDLDQPAYETHSYEDSDKTSFLKKKFAGTRKFRDVDTFETSEAPEGTQTFFGANRQAREADQAFSTPRSSLADRMFGRRKDTAPEESKKYWDASRAAPEDSASTTNATVSLAQDDSGRLVPTESSLSEQQVRDLLHPEG